MSNRPRTILDKKGFCWFKGAFVGEELRYLRYYVHKPNPTDKDEDHLYNLYTSLKSWHILRSIAKSHSDRLLDQMYLEDHYFQLVLPKNEFVYSTKWRRDCYPIQFITPLEDCKLLIETQAIKEELTEIFAGDTVAIPTEGRITLTSEHDKTLPIWVSTYTFRPKNIGKRLKTLNRFIKPKHQGIYAKNTEV